ncbi:hypothetical protein bcere0019_23150 [Bacillus cereus Rock3-28]|nr:hypothetical protein bcere0019_23150 [Bacillus cereus Rock3-28]
MLSVINEWLIKTTPILMNFTIQAIFKQQKHVTIFNENSNVFYL